MAKRKWARGRRARFICQRTGWEIPYKYATVEPGTQFWVDRRWSDGKWNQVDHEQNFSPKDIADEAPLRLATGGTEFPPETVANSLAEVSLPGGGGIIVETELSSVTCVALVDENCKTLLTDTSATLEGCFVFLEFNQVQKI